MRQKSLFDMLQRRPREVEQDNNAVVPDLSCASSSRISQSRSHKRPRQGTLKDCKKVVVLESGSSALCFSAADISRIGKTLDGQSESTAEELLEALRKLSSYYLSVDVLLETGVGKLVRRLKRHSDAHVARVAENLCLKWTDLATFKPNSGRQASSQPSLAMGQAGASVPSTHARLDCGHASSAPGPRPVMAECDLLPSNQAPVPRAVVQLHAATVQGDRIVKEKDREFFRRALMHALAGSPTALRNGNSRATVVQIVSSIDTQVYHRVTRRRTDSNHAELRRCFSDATRHILEAIRGNDTLRTSVLCGWVEPADVAAATPEGLQTLGHIG
mmetsp:Transcript_37353/g.71598  ORF Transcript_37353/g.71598 Transcript_37353/m.71598 type:complete len:331 (-) Transcript_37353:694-1686(-)